MKTWFARMRSRGPTTQSAVLTVAVLVLYAAVAPVAGLLSGPAGLAAAALAAGLCWAGAELALLACRRFCDPSRAWLGVLIGMLLRMGLPLLSALVIQVQGGRLAKAGLLLYLLVFYPVTLFIETALSLPSGEPPPRHRDAPAKVVS